MINTNTAETLPIRLKPANLYLHFTDNISDKTWKQLAQCKEESKVHLLTDMFRPIWPHFGKKVLS